VVAVEEAAEVEVEVEVEVEEPLLAAVPEAAVPELRLVLEVAEAESVRTRTLEGVEFRPE